MASTERARGATLLDGGAPLGAALGSLIIAGPHRRIRLVAVFFRCGWRRNDGLRPASPGGISATIPPNIRRSIRLKLTISPRRTPTRIRLPAAPSGASTWAYFRHRSVVVHVPRLDVLQRRFLRPPDLDADLSLCGAWPRHQAARRRAVRHVLRRVRRRADRWPDRGRWRARGGPAEHGLQDAVRHRGGRRNCLSIFGVAYVSDPLDVVLLLCSTLFFLRWCGMYWAIPGILASRARSGFLGGCMNLAGNIAGITVPVIVGFIVQATGSYFLGPDILRLRGGRAFRLLDADRLQRQAGGLRPPPLNLHTPNVETANARTEFDWEC